MTRPIPDYRFSPAELALTFALAAFSVLAVIAAIGWQG